MTGHGQAAVQSEKFRVVAEVRTVNNRFLKTSINGDFDAAHMAKLEALIKKHVSRGSVNVRIKIDMLDGSNDRKLNEKLLRAY